MPAAYFPHAQGLSLPEGAELVGTLLKDPCIRIVEISEYAALVISIRVTSAKSSTCSRTD